MKSSNGTPNVRSGSNGTKEKAVRITERDVTAYWCKERLEHFTRYFFKKRFKKKFILNDHHLKIFDVLQRVFSGELRKVIINMPPRYGKTEIVVHNLIAYGLALNASSKFIHLSYSDSLAASNSERVRDIVKSAEYGELFPYVKIKHQTDSKKKWETVQGGGVYATAAAGQVTGFGAGEMVDDSEDGLNDAQFAALLEEIFGTEGFAGALVIDDPIKPEDANSETMRNRVNDRWDNTISNRVNSRNTPIIIIGQRLHENDLSGYVIDKDGILSEHNPDGWFVLSLPAIVDEGLPTEHALWELKHTLAELKRMKARLGIVFDQQYQQDPKPLKGLLYKTFRTYTALPIDAQRAKVKAVIDTADTGTDWLCCIVYIATVIGYYVIDVYYTDDPMEITEGETALILTTNGVRETIIESNNGGRSFARNVEAACRKMLNRLTSFRWFHQSKNKEARILSNAATVQNMIFYPADWESRWALFAKHVKAFQAKGKNPTDDPEDTLTMIIEEEKPNQTTGGARRVN